MSRRGRRSIFTLAVHCREQVRLRFGHVVNVLDNSVPTFRSSAGRTGHRMTRIGSQRLSATARLAKPVSDETVTTPFERRVSSSV